MSSTLSGSSSLYNWDHVQKQKNLKTSRFFASPDGYLMGAMLESGKLTVLRIVPIANISKVIVIVLVPVLHWLFVGPQVTVKTVGTNVTKRLHLIMEICDGDFVNDFTKFQVSVCTRVLILSSWLVWFVQTSGDMLAMRKCYNPTEATFVTNKNCGKYKVIIVDLYPCIHWWFLLHYPCLHWWSLLRYP